jgi:predicted phage-related endonuclease
MSSKAMAQSGDRAQAPGRAQAANTLTSLTHLNFEVDGAMTIRKRRRGSFDEWMSWREPNINASEAGAMFKNVDPFRTPLALYHEKRGEAPVLQETARMRLGRWLEPAVLTALRERHPDWKIDAHHYYYDDPDAHVGCTPDAIVIKPDGSRHCLQAKVVSKFAIHKWKEGEDEHGMMTVPLSYQLQNVIETSMTGCDAGIVAPLFLEDVEVYDLAVPRRDDKFEMVKRQSVIFWDMIRNGNPPDLNAAEDAELIKKLYPADDGSTIDLSEHPKLIELRELLLREADLAAKISAANDAMKPFVKAREEMRTIIKSLMGSATTAILPGYQITWKTQSRRASESRVLRIKEV